MIKYGLHRLQARAHRQLAGLPAFMNLTNEISALTRQVSQLKQELAASRAIIDSRLGWLEIKSSGLPMVFNGDFYQRGDEGRLNYWSTHNVTNHQQFRSARESLDNLIWRNNNYPGYIDLMPNAGQDGKVVLDYGCGPGHDLVGFSVYSKPARLIGADVSPVSIREAKQRLELHGAACEFILLPEDASSIPLDDESVDYIHCSGVLMLSQRPADVLKEFRRILRPGGQIQLMVYNYDSLWMHLYVAYMVQLDNGIYADRTLLEAFSRTTDGEYCPHVTAWTKADVAALAEEAGLESAWLGASVSLWELHILPLRFKAMMDPRLPREHHDFLSAITLDSAGLPSVAGDVCGIDACYTLRKAA